MLLLSVVHILSLSGARVLLQRDRSPTAQFNHLWPVYQLEWCTGLLGASTHLCGVSFFSLRCRVSNGTTRWLTIVYNSGSRDLVLSSGLFGHRCTWYTDKHGDKHIHTLIYHLCVCGHGHVLRSEDNFVELVVSTFKWILEIELRLPALCRKCLHHLLSLAFTLLTFQLMRNWRHRRGITSHGPTSVNDTTLLSIISTHLAAMLTGLLLNLM